MTRTVSSKASFRAGDGGGGDDDDDIIIVM